MIPMDLEIGKEYMIELLNDVGYDIILPKDNEFLIIDKVGIGKEYTIELLNDVGYDTILLKDNEFLIIDKVGTYLGTEVIRPSMKDTEGYKSYVITRDITYEIFLKREKYKK